MILLHIAGYSLLLVLIIKGFFVARNGQEAFMEYLKEDGFVENLTALSLLAASAVSIYRCFNRTTGSSSFYYVTWIALAFLFFFAAGEEISWGQRIFHFGTTGFFEQNNLQHETNLHNLVIGNVKINKLVFSQMFAVVFGLYFLLLKPLSLKSGFFKHLVTTTGVPLPRWHQIAAMVIAVILVSQYHLKKAAELREVAFAVIMLLIFLYPAITEKTES